MKIAHVTSEICRRSAGLGVAVAGISAWARQPEDDVRVFGIASDDWYSSDCETWSGATASLYRARPYSGPFKYSSELYDGLMQFAPDIVHLHGLWTYSGIAVKRWYQATGKNYLISAHGMLMPTSLCYNRFRKSIARKLYQNSVIDSAKALHATSDTEEHSYRQLNLTNDVTKISLGINPPAISTDRREKKTAVYLGRIHHQKGTDLLVQAWQRIYGSFNDWQLLIAGPATDEWSKRLISQITNTRPHGIRYCGPLYGREKENFLLEASIFIMPSRSENFGLSAFEAMSYALPIIATTAVPLSNLSLIDAGYSVPATVDGIAEALRSMLNQSIQARRSMGLNARNHVVNELSWVKLGDAYRSQYSNYIGKR